MSKVHYLSQEGLAGHVPAPKAETDAPGFQRSVTAAQTAARGSLSDYVSQATVVEGSVLDEIIAKQYQIAWTSADPKAAVAALERQYARSFRNSGHAMRPQPLKTRMPAEIETANIALSKANITAEIRTRFGTGKDGVYPASQINAAAAMLGQLDPTAARRFEALAYIGEGALPFLLEPITEVITDFARDWSAKADGPPSPPASSGPVRTTALSPAVEDPGAVPAPGAGTPPLPPGPPPAPPTVPGGSQDPGGLPLLGGDSAARAAFRQYIAPYFGEDPERTFVDLYFAGHHGSRIQFSAESKEGIPVLTFAGVLESQKATRILAVMTCDISPTKGVAFLESLAFHQQGNDLAKPLIAGQIEAYRRMGLRRVELLASSTVGSYAWAKYGWLPVSVQEWIDLASKIRSRMEMMSAGNGSRVYGRITRSDKSIVEAILARGDPKDIWTISDLTQLTGVDDGLGRPMTLGKALLLNEQESRHKHEWRGALYLDNPEQMERFYDYVGRRNR